MNANLLLERLFKDEMAYWDNLFVTMDRFMYRVFGVDNKIVFEKPCNAIHFYELIEFLKEA